MKKFKTRRKMNYLKIFFLIILLILFIILSFTKLNKSYSKLVTILTKDFNNDNIQIMSLTNNLDYLINDYSFQKVDKVYKENNNKIYLYNTHDLEKYNDGTTIIQATNVFKNNLSKLGLKVIQEKSQTSELLYTGLSHYNITRLFLQNIMKKEKDIKYYIDIHRDSVKDTKVKINDKNYAKIMFVLGLENKNYKENKQVMIKMNNYLNEHYPGISRGIYEKKGEGVDGIYNQDLDKNIILIEVGGIENNLEEINNSTEILSLMIYHMLGD